MSQAEEPEPESASDLIHRVRVFVFGFQASQANYLLVRRDQGVESFWTPLHGVLGHGEKLEHAVCREVREDAGSLRPLEIIDLKMPAVYRLGDEQVIEWAYGCRAGAGQVELQKGWAEYRWADFTEAFPALEFEQDRAAIMRLHTLLHAA